jgi:hypothetical protein
MRWFLVIALVAACGKSKATCKAEVADLMTLFRTMDRSPPLAVPADVHLVERPELPVFDGVYAPVVIARATGFEFRGEHLDELGLTVRLAEVWNKQRDDIEAGKVPRDFKWDHRVYVLIDRDTPWSAAVTTVRVASLAGYTKWIAVFSKPSPVAQPPRSAVSDQLDKILKDDGGGNQATAIAKLMSDVVRSCPAMGKAFGAVGSEENADKGKVLIEATEPALIECNCDIDLPSFRSVFVAIGANFHPLTVLRLELDEKIKPLALPGTTPWRDAVKQLTTATTWLTAELP